jgi:hypothetical protein
MTRAEMIGAVERLCSADGDEAELDALIEQLDQALPYVSLSNLIFHERHGLSPEGIVDEALRRERTVRASGLWNMGPPKIGQP